MSWHEQKNFTIRFEWGLEGAKQLSTCADVIIIVDVLSFSTCVDIGVSQGAEIYPYLYKDERSLNYAQSLKAKLANSIRSKSELSLSPSTFHLIQKGDKVVLPSPNGATISFEIESKTILCGCLRNAKAIAEAAMNSGKNILIIAAGEKWNNGALRPALEDMIGAGAIIVNLKGNKSAESLAAEQVFSQSELQLLTTIKSCSSGQELIQRGFPEDVELACELNVSQIVPILKNKKFVSLV